ncbi:MULTISPECIES: hypothetical protein [Legionella]|uniref:Uncharacterized protein n=1 Tax=Legionella resiliens TaxID=2905958 RepID=A0ABS8X321_9GAMM|nr:MULTISPECIES: hypothetical protein [unclassified Legionella]MCE0724008.1 hypothetical protein [Legionella sp. 9fVS26]MCE3533161.1 hypothetical protein [Legionella sp. 8cVS16]QLZ69340.1 hypothetical protein FOLKNPGA_02123 [Legionella sp. PC1000]
MQSKYMPDMGFDLDDAIEDEKVSSINVSNQSLSDSSQTHVEPSEPSITTAVTFSTSQESFESSSVSSYETEYNETDKNQKLSGESDESTSSNPYKSSEKSSDSWAGAKFLLSPIAFLADMITTPFSGKNPVSSTESDEMSSKQVVDENFDEVDYLEHQKSVDSTNKILAAAVDTVYGALMTSREECEQHTFHCKEREKLDKKTGNTKNEEMVNVNVFLDKKQKPLLPGARKTLKKHAEAKQQAKKDCGGDLPPPSEAVTHAKTEFEIAHEFAQGEDDYDKAGSVIHTAKGVAEISALDLETFTGGVTAQPGFVTPLPSNNFLYNLMIENSKKVVEQKFKKKVTGEENSEIVTKPSSMKQ